MTLPRIERRLAAILATDVAGYSRLMGIDEVGTHTALQAHRRERVDPITAQHHGRIVKTTGDGLLVEFASVVDSVICAVAIQRAMLEANAGIDEDRQIRFRIGINVGDIIIDGGDIFGDGVNVAARLEALCEPGGVCISRSANDQVRDKLLLTFADLGEQTVKNIARAVGVFGLTAKDIAALPEEALPQPEPGDAPAAPSPERRTRAGPMVGVTIVAAALLAAGGWWLLRDRASPPVTSTPVTSTPVAVTLAPAAYSPHDRRLSVIVLPFENSSGDPAQAGLASGITRDVTDTIARDPLVPVIPAATAATYHGRPLDLRAIAREHDVHFVLTGSARRQDGRLIVSATLNDAVDLRQVWSQYYDRPDQPDELGSIIRRIAVDSQQAGMDAEAARAKREHPNDLDKRDLMLATATSQLQPGTKENFLAKLALTERALALDPDYVWALAENARMRALLVSNDFAPATMLNEAVKAADRALLLEPSSTNVLRVKAIVLRAQGDLDGAAALLRQVIRMEPLWGYRYNDLGGILLMQGRAPEALENFQTARRLAAPIDAVNFIDANLAMALLANGRFAEAIAQARLAMAEYTPKGGRAAEYPWLTLIAAEVGAGEDQQARADLQKFLAAPRILSSLAEVQKIQLLAANPKLLDGLRRAGMPAE